MNKETIKKELTGYPSIDKPWLKYYSEEAINAPLPECSIYEYLWECNKDHLSDFALNYFGKKMTYETLFFRIDTAARAFRAIGVKEGDIVSIVTVSTVASVICFYALNRIGAVSNFLNVLLEENDLQTYFEEAQSKVVVSLDLFAEKVMNASAGAGVEKVILFSIDYEMPLATKMGYRLKNRKQKKYNSNYIEWDLFLKLGEKQHKISYTKDPRKMCILAHTGGTTGEPKAVMLSDYAMNAVASQYILASGIRRKDVFLNLMIPFVVYGILANVHIPLCLGLEDVIIPRFNSSDWKKYIKKYHPNHVLAVPAYINPMLSDENIQKMNLSCLISAGVGGDGMTDEIEIKLNDLYKRCNSKAKVLKGYGLTEVCATAVVGFSHSNKIGSVGIPLIHNNVMIYNTDNNSELKYNETGEICLQCPSRMIGYMNNDKATGELFHIHEDGTEWLHTGDLGYMDEDGFLYLTGRIKRMILTTKDGVAYKVFPSVPEKVLEENEAVQQCCIVGADDNGDQVLRAFVVITEGQRSDINQIEQELRSLCEAKLPSYSRPSYYIFLDALPLTASGKVDYRKLEEMTNE